MFRLRHVRTRAALLLTLVVWLLGFFASDVHHRVVRHVVCAEHGEVTELVAHDADADDRDEGPTYAPLGDAQEHHDGCSLPALPPPVSPTRLAAFALPPCEPTPYHALAGTDTRVTGPLRYAPKTSPPTV